MDDVPQNAMLFFEQHPESYPLYEAFYEKLMSRFPEAKAKVQKSQISFYNRHLFACVSFLRVKKKADLPERYFVLTLGLPEPLDSGRAAAKTEPYPGRWTTHFVISETADLNEQDNDYKSASGESGGYVYRHQARHTDGTGGCKQRIDPSDAIDRTSWKHQQSRPDQNNSHKADSQYQRRIRTAS